MQDGDTLRYAVIATREHARTCKKKTTFEAGLENANT